MPRRQRCPRMRLPPTERPSAPHALATLACPSTARDRVILPYPTRARLPSGLLTARAAPRRPQALLNAFEPGAVVTGTVSEHLLGHGILVDVGGMYDGCAAYPTLPYALTRRRAAAALSPGVRRSARACAVTQGQCH